MQLHSSAMSQQFPKTNSRKTQIQDAKKAVQTQIANTNANPG